MTNSTARTINPSTSRKKIRAAVFLGLLITVMCLFILLFLSLNPQSILITFAIICCTTGVVCCVAIALVVMRIKVERDVSERTFLENQERYRSIIAASNTGVWEYHSDTNYLWCSPEYFEMLGIKIEANIGYGIWNVQKLWIDRLHPDDQQEATENFDLYLKNGGPDLYEGYFRMKHESGKWLWIWSRGKTLQNADGTRSNITLGTHINITEKKNLEIELMQYNDKLLKYASMNAHNVRGPVARLLGLIAISKLKDSDYPDFFEKIKHEATCVDEILHKIMKELSEIEDRKFNP
jgi:PAS domain S-box-containing protein